MYDLRVMSESNWRFNKFYLVWTYCAEQVFCCFFASPTFCRNLLLLHLQPRFGGHLTITMSVRNGYWKPSG